MKFIWTFYFLGILCVHGMAQLYTSSNVPDTTMARILRGTGMTLYNPHYTGAPEANAYFYGPSGLPYTEGLLLTTGTASLAASPNNQSAMGTNLHLSGDTDLAQIIGWNTYDACILEFDCIPQYDNIRFNFVFASEEYPEYSVPSPQGKHYFDIMAVLITGPMPGGGTYDKKNIALVPGTTSPVGVSSVNNGTANVGPCMNCAYYINNIGGQTIQYDGYTTDLLGSVTTIPDSTYHIKIVIADIDDEIYDSGVFLPRYTFRSEGLLGVQDIQEQLDLTVLPNPATRFLHIRSLQEPITRCLIHDLTGQCVKDIHDPDLTTVAIDDLQNGLYMVELHTAKGIVTKKIVKN